MCKKNHKEVKLPLILPFLCLVHFASSTVVTNEKNVSPSKLKNINRMNK